MNRSSTGEHALSQVKKGEDEGERTPSLREADLEVKQVSQGQAQARLPSPLSGPKKKTPLSVRTGNCQKTMAFFLGQRFVKSL
eukprot:scaffold57505_cov31-Tisochrysis_lutea.AAC.1